MLKTLTCRVKSQRLCSLDLTHTTVSNSQKMVSKNETNKDFCRQQYLIHSAQEHVHSCTNFYSNFSL